MHHRVKPYTHAKEQKVPPSRVMERQLSGHLVLRRFMFVMRRKGRHGTLLLGVKTAVAGMKFYFFFFPGNVY